MSADFVYLSPHLDDAALSCGGQIARQTRLGKRALVVTVCAGDPPVRAAGSAFVRELHARWGADNPTAARRLEDLAAMQVLGAETLHLGVLDCVYRLSPRTGRPLYPDVEAIFGALSEEEDSLIDEMARQLRRLEPLWGTTVYAPLGVGHHVDHQLVRAAAGRWGAPGGRLAYYEDYPYAEASSAVEATLRGSDLSPEIIRLDQVDMERKIAAVSSYRSQLSTFFEDDAEMARRLAAFAHLTAGGSGLAERVWSNKLARASHAP